MRKIERPAKTMKFHEVGLGLMIVEFDEQHDKRRIIREGPWNFDRNLIFLQDFEGKQQVSHIIIKERLSSW